MRALVIALLAACGGPQNASHPADQPPEVAAYPALRWAPDAPTYLVSAHTVKDGQRAIRDAIDSFGMLALATPADVSAAMQAALGVDPLGPDLGAKLGVDLDGGVAVFSEGLSPTLVVHLAAPAATRAFFARLPALGVAPTIATVEGVEIATARLHRGPLASWAIDGDWLWLHLAFHDELPSAPSTAWFTHPHHAATPTWREGFAWAAKLASHAGPIVGLWNNRAVLATIAALMRADAQAKEAVACVTALEVVDRVGFAIDGDGSHVGGRLALDVGPAAPKIAAAILPPPPGFAALAAAAPLAGQWNLDVDAMASGLAPCLAAMGLDPSELTSKGIRAARGVLETFDPDSRSGTGAIAFDLSSKTVAEQLLDQIPHRSLLESDRTFGAYRGKHIGIPMVLSVDYVLDDKLALAAMGDGLLAQLVSGTAPANPPLFAFDVRTAPLADGTWTWLCAHFIGRGGGELASLLLHWRDAHIALSIEHGALVLDASGNRR